jgi:RNA polymerase sigma-54 factor
LHDIRCLQPHPGAQIGEIKPNCIVPDVLVSQQAKGWLVELNPETVPKLRINAEYAALIKRANDSDDNLLLKDHLQAARVFMNNVQTRHDTVLQVARCIVAAQHDFFEQGVEAMKPLILQTVADSLGLHESTVSRVTSQKYMQTPRGTFAFKYFFSSHVRTTSGGTVSATAVSALIKKTIQAEDPQKPLSDNVLAQQLSELGVHIARRTVTKYRESLRIPASSERRRWAG